MHKKMHYEAGTTESSWCAIEPPFDERLCVGARITVKHPHIAKGTFGANRSISSNLTVDQGNSGQRSVGMVPDTPSFCLQVDHRTRLPAAVGRDRLC